jgi:hypothetical protein
VDRQSSTCVFHRIFWKGRRKFKNKRPGADVEEGEIMLLREEEVAGEEEEVDAVDQLEVVEGAVAVEAVNRQAGEP